MGLLENLVVDRAWSKRIREFMKRVQAWNAKSAKSSMAIEQRLDDLAADIGFLALLEVATLKLLTDKGVLAEGDLVPRLAMADLLDGIEDGSLDPSALRSIIGLSRAGGKPAKDATRRHAAATAGKTPSPGGRGGSAAPETGGGRGARGTPRRARSKRKK